MQNKKGAVPIIEVHVFLLKAINFFLNKYIFNKDYIFLIYFPAMKLLYHKVDIVNC